MRVGFFHKEMGAFDGFPTQDWSITSQDILHTAALELSNTRDVDIFVNVVCTFTGYILNVCCFRRVQKTHITERVHIPCYHWTLNAYQTIL